MQAERMAAVWARRADLLVETLNQTSAGVWISSNPVWCAPLTITDAELGELVLRSLTASRSGVPHPMEWKEFPSSLLEVAGVRTWNSLLRNSTRSEVEVCSDEIRVYPTRNGGAHGDDRGFQTLKESGLSIARGVAGNELGEAIRRALAKCE